MGATTATVLGRYGAFPAPGGAGFGLLLDGGTAPLLLGCGSGVAGRLGHALAVPGDLGAVLLPDLRPDHCSDLWPIGSLAAAAARAGRRRGLLPVYAFGAPAERWAGLQRPGVVDLRRFAAADTVHAAGWTCAFAPLRHGWPGLAVRLEGPGGPLALVGPTAPDPALEGLCAGVRLLVVATGGPKDIDPEVDGGLDPAAAGRLARACGAERLLLGHLDPADDPAALLAAARAEHPAAALALEGRTYEL